MRAGKKGVAFEALMWAFKIFFLIIILVSLVLLIRSFIVTELDIFNAEVEIVIQRILLARNSISYYDADIDRLYPGIIDMARFTSETIAKELNETIFYGNVNKKIATNITLYNNNGQVIKSIIYTEDYYYRWKEMLEARWNLGPGGVKGKIRSYRVLVRDEEKIIEGKLLIEVILPNS